MPPLPFLDSTLDLPLDSLELTLLSPVLRATDRPQLPQHGPKSQIHGGPEYCREGSPPHAYHSFPSTSGAEGKECLFYHVVGAQIIELSNAKGVALAGWLALVADVDAAIFFYILLSLTLTHSPVDWTGDPRICAAYRHGQPCCETMADWEEEEERKRNLACLLFFEFFIRTTHLHCLL